MRCPSGGRFGAQNDVGDGCGEQQQQQQQVDDWVAEEVEAAGERVRRDSADGFVGPSGIVAAEGAPENVSDGFPPGDHQAPRRVRDARRSRGRGQRHEHHLPTEAEHHRPRGHGKGALVRMLGQRVSMITQDDLTIIIDYYVV